MYQYWWLNLFQYILAKQACFTCAEAGLAGADEL